MNKIIKTEYGYTLITENDNEYPCTRWYEKKTDSWHVKLSKEGQAETGRTYIRENHFVNSDIYEFENKTEHRTGLASGGWRAKMTDDERKQVEEAEKLIESIKSICMTREVEKVDPNSEEGILLQIERLKKKLENKRGQA